jgi:glycosyltransferase involved in cell wall biosynthesis
VKVVLVTDTWHPQVNGVVRVLNATADILSAAGQRVEVIEPSQFRNAPLPCYPDIRMAYNISPLVVRRALRPPCAVHIATEFFVGLAFRRYCERLGIPFTTSLHTDLPAYLKKYAGLPPAWVYAYLRWFHRPARAVLVSTPTLANTLCRHGIQQVQLWTKGVDAEFFHPRPSILGPGKPVCLYVGRIAKEKNVEAFLKCQNDVRKFVVGDGPLLPRLRAKYPEVAFLGRLGGESLAEIFASADCFVFPSKTDTLGMVLLEALASGVPVAAYPVPGPQDLIVRRGRIGCLHDDLEVAIEQTLRTGDRLACRRFAMEHSWKKSAEEFLAQQILYGKADGRHGGETSKLP